MSEPRPLSEMSPPPAFCLGNEFARSRMPSSPLGRSASAKALGVGNNGFTA